jgi:hypothetical protein
MVDYRRLSAVVLCLLFGACDRKEPRLELQSTEIDFGVVIRGQELRTRFPLKNSGTRQLTITGFRLSCSCQPTPGFPRVIEPGDEQAIELRISTDRLPEGDQRGPLMHLSTNDPRLVEVGLFFRADIRSEFRVAPDWIDFGRAAHDQAPSRTVEVTFMAPGVGVASVRSTDPSVDARLDRGGNVAVSRKATIRLTRRAGRPPGAHSGVIIITTTSQFTSEVRIPVFGVIDQ